MNKPSEKLINFFKKKNRHFFILANEDYYDDPEHNTPEFYYVAFETHSPGYIGDGWYLTPSEDAGDWPDVDKYGNSEEFQGEINNLLSHPAIGMELYSCSYEVEEADLKEVEDYLLGLGLTKGTPAWIEEQHG